MRSGEPDAMDRMVGFAFGGLAVQLLERGETARMVTLSDGNYATCRSTPCSTAASRSTSARSTTRRAIAPG